MGRRNLNYTHKMTDLPFLLMILRQNEQGRRHSLWESACSLILTKMHPACGGVGGLLTPEELNLNHVTHEKRLMVRDHTRKKELEAPILGLIISRQMSREVQTHQMASPLWV